MAREIGELLFVFFSGPAGESRGGGGRALGSFPASLASPVQALPGEGGGGVKGIAAMEHRENPGRARQSVESLHHIKMPY